MTKTESLSDKERYEAILDAELRECNARLELLRAKIALTTIDLRLPVSHEVSRLTLLKSGLSAKLNEMRQLGEAGWKRMCASIDAARAELADGLENLADKMR